MKVQKSELVQNFISKKLVENSQVQKLQRKRDNKSKDKKESQSVK